LADARGHVIGVNTMVAGRLALAIPSNAVRDFLASRPRSAWLGVTVHPVRLPRANGRAFGLVVLEVASGGPAAQASLMAGDILLGTEEKRFQTIEDLATAIDGEGTRLLRFEFLRGDYSRVRRVTVRLGDSNGGKDRIAA
jgi:serine protease Do